MRFLPSFSPLGPAARLLTDTMSSIANDPSYTFSDRAIGAPDPDRYIVAAVSMGDDGVSAAATAVKIQDITAVQVVGISVAASSESNYAGLWIAKVPLLTTGTVFVQGNTTMTDCGVTLYRVTGIVSPTPTDIAVDSGVKSSFALATDVKSRGIAIGIGTSDVQGTAVTWSVLAEDIDVQHDNMRHTSASQAFLADAAGAAIALTMGAGRGCCAAAHWASA